MIKGPAVRSKIDHTLSYTHDLKQGKKYAIKTTRDNIGKAHFAMMIFKIYRKKSELFFKVDDLLSEVTYGLEFEAKKKNESLEFTYWMLKGEKWGQVKREVLFPDALQKESYADQDNY